jgi:GNAT superfamily N-acetyltransferase
MWLMPARDDDDQGVRVRTATVEDAAIVADVYLRSWIAGYDGLVDPDELAGAAAARADYDWALVIADPASRVGLGFVDGSAAGVAVIGPDPTEDVRATWLERLYVAPEFWGTGAATALLRWALDQAGAMHAPFVLLRVVEAQERARRFYEREGWSYDADVPPAHNGFFPLLCMRTDLT